MTLNLTLSKKIPLAITLATLVTAGALSVGAVRELTIQAEDGITQDMKVTLDGKKAELDNFMKRVVGDVHSMADNPHVLKMLNEFSAAYKQIPDAKNYLQTQYITKNPNEAGKKDMMDVAEGDNTTYGKLHAEHHPYLHEFLQEHGYYDIFIVDAEGNVVYTVFKELDFATNLLHGEWKDSDVAKVYRNIMAQKSAEEVSSSDYAPYPPSNNIPAGFIGRPIQDETGKYAGAFIYQLPIGDISKIFSNEENLGKTGVVHFVGADGLLRNDARFAKEPTTLKEKDETIEAKLALQGKSGIDLDVTGKTGIPVVKSYTPYEFDGHKYALTFEMSRDEVYEYVVNARNNFVMIALAIVAVIAALGVFFARSITNAISKITAAMRQVADGDLTTDIPSLSRKDEIGSMAGALQVFKENGQAMKQMEAEQEKLKQRAEEDRKKALHDMASTFEANVKSVVDIVAAAAAEMDATSRSVAGISDNNNKKLQKLTNEIGSTSRNVQMVAGATTQLSSAVNEISQQVARSTTIAANAVQEAQNADVTVQSLTEAAQRIGEVIEMINSIAAQINLLALNATIEAARAGEAGKGFAVVASEVKNLAGQTTKATEQIGQYIDSIQSATGDTVSAIKRIGGTINEISHISTTIAAAVEEQGVATQDIASNVQQAAKGTETIAHDAAEVSASSTESGVAANEMMGATSELSRQAETLRSEVDKFLVGVRKG
ncbi:MAG: methyl-accepting chemotaxis protein [Alphaproteobacteria bacterium]|nr:methyl-accepting chemotaxis protein [Alphaproteobacteria bacterium]